MNWEPIIIAAISAIPPTLIGAAAYIQARKARAQSEETHHAVDGRMDELLELTRESSKAKGVLQQKESQEG